MYIMIDIQCKTIGELKDHLSKILEQVERNREVFKLENDGEFQEGVRVSFKSEGNYHTLDVVEVLEPESCK